MNERETPEPTATVSDLDIARVRQNWELRKTRQPNLAKLESRIARGQTIVSQGDVIQEPVAFFVIQGSLLEIIHVAHKGQEFREVINEVGPGGLAFCQGVTGHADKKSLISVVASGSDAVIARFRREHIEQLGISMTVVASLFEGMRRTLALLAKATVDRFDEAAEFATQRQSAMEMADEAYREMTEAEERATGAEERASSLEQEVERLRSRLQSMPHKEAERLVTQMHADLQVQFQATQEREVVACQSFHALASLLTESLEASGMTLDAFEAGLRERLLAEDESVTEAILTAVRWQLEKQEQEEESSIENPLDLRRTEEWVPRKDSLAASAEEASAVFPTTFHVDLEYQDPACLEAAHDTQVGLAPPEPQSDMETRDTVPVPPMDEEEQSMETDRPASLPGELQPPPSLEEPETPSAKAVPRRQTDVGGLEPPVRHQTITGLAPVGAGTPRPPENPTRSKRR